MIGAVGSVGRLGLVARRGRLLLYPAYVQDYLDRVTAADVSAGDTQGLELAVTDAFNTCLQAMVGDGSLGVSGATPEVQVLSQSASLIKASCLMMGARTLSGALVPIAADMPAPTNFNFVTGDYDRKTGLIGNSTTKYLNTNRAPSEDPQDSTHISTYVNSTAATTPTAYIASTRTTAPGVFSQIIDNSGQLSGTINSQASVGVNSAGNAHIGFFGVSRTNNTTLTLRFNGSNSTSSSSTSLAPSSLNYFVFARNLNGTAGLFSNRRHNFYSIGRALDLAILDARIAALTNAIQAAIP